jgi:ATP adenylyltransferase
MAGFVNLNTKQRPDGKYGQVIKDIQKDGVCPFCTENLQKYHKNPILFETKHWLITDNMYPYANSGHHALLIHKIHIEYFDQITAAAWQELQTAFAKLLKLKNMPGGTIVFRFGDTSVTGASVTHLHASLACGTGKPGAEAVIARVG